MQAHERTGAILALTSALMLAVGCDPGGKAPAGGAEAGAQPEGKAADGKTADAKAPDAKAPDAKAAGSNEPRFAEDLRKDPCSLLTPAQVAKAAGVDASALESRMMSGMCMYEWDAGAAMLGFVTVAKSPEKARERFERSYRSMTGEEAKAHMKAIGDQAKEKLEEDAKEGKASANPAAVKPVAGAMGQALGDGFLYEPVTGVGDAALWDATKRTMSIGGREIVTYGNELKVLVSNMYFTLQLRVGPGDKEYREQGIALAKEVVAAL